SDGSINSYTLRLQDGKRQTILALRNLNYKTIAVGDSYNDIAMLKEADAGIFFRPPDSIKNEFPELTLSYEYKELKNIIKKIIYSSNAK
ncbi:MAG: HAD hydrolase family protein, partial [Desulfobacterales bacterium]|nr:HAD hydrolase family protein [Desulfobacterales bacterium]